MPRAAIRSLADIAELQWGLFTRQQAESTGMAWTTLARAAKHGIAERVTHGVYRLRGTPADEHRATRAAWLQLAPDTMAPDRTIGQGVACRGTAAAVYGLSVGLGPADVHHFTLPARRQTRRADVRLYRAVLSDRHCARVNGLLVTRPGRIISDLMHDGEDLGIVAQLTADALREAKDTPQEVAAAIASHAAWFGLAEHDGPALLNWLLQQTPTPQQQRLQPSSGLDSALSEAAAIGGPYLLVRSAESAPDNAARTTIRLTTVMRQGPPRRVTSQR